MTVVHFSKSETGGGASRAAFGIHRSLLDAGCDSWMVVSDRVEHDPNVIGSIGGGFAAKLRQRGLEFLYAALIQTLKPKAMFFPDCLGTADVRRLRLPASPDIIHLHWVSCLLTSRDVWKLWARYGAPVVWTVMDMAALTGGCHYSAGCQGYTERCGACPVIGSHRAWDITRRAWNSKRKWLGRVPITLVGATQWVLDRVRKSSLFSGARVVKIPYGIDSTVFRPRPRALVRELLDLPRNSRIVFFGAENHREERKGVGYLVTALRQLREQAGAGQPPTLLLLAGRTHSEYTRQLPFPHVELGQIHGDRFLAMAYQAADVFVCPSIEDAGPLMIPESLMCGTPVVAFAECGGAPDVLEKGVNGYLAESRNSQDLARGIQQTFMAAVSGAITQESCRNSVLHDWTMEVQASRYLALYRELVEADSGADSKKLRPNSS